MTIEELAERMSRRFKGVPNFDEEDAIEAVEDAARSLGLDPSDSVPAKYEQLILLKSQYETAWDIAFAVAHYFSYTDGEESVDKSMVSENYRKLAESLRKDYDEERWSINSSDFRIMKRLDKDVPVRRIRTIPEGWRGKWR